MSAPSAGAMRAARRLSPWTAEAMDQGDVACEASIKRRAAVIDYETGTADLIAAARKLLDFLATTYERDFPDGYLELRAAIAKAEGNP